MCLILFVAGPGGRGRSQRRVQREAAGETVSNILLFCFMNYLPKFPKSFQNHGSLLIFPHLFSLFLQVNVNAHSSQQKTELL